MSITPDSTRKDKPPTERRCSTKSLGPKWQDTLIRGRRGSTVVPFLPFLTWRSLDKSSPCSETSRRTPSQYPETVNGPSLPRHKNRLELVWRRRDTITTFTDGLEDPKHLIEGDRLTPSILEKNGGRNLKIFGFPSCR